MKNGKKLAVFIMVLVVLAAGIGIYSFQKRNQVVSVVSLDVNPSIELHVDEDGEVVKAHAVNVDGEKVLEGMKLKGADADTAVNAIVGSLLRNGYIDQIANSILLTVEDEDTARGARLKEELTKEINDILKATAVHAAVLSQDMKETKLAKEADISEGKATLVENIIDANETYDAKELAKLSVNELNLIVSNSKNQVKNVSSTGSASDSAYIGREKALEKAFAHAGVKEAEVKGAEAELDFEYGTMVYEVEFTSGQYEYDYSVDGKSGEILHSHREVDEDYRELVIEKEETSKKETSEKKETTNKKETSASVSKKETEEKKETTSKTETIEKKETTSKKETADIGKEKAKSIALTHAGLVESAVSRLKVERDLDDGRVEYNVEFTAKGSEYDYEVDGASGKILDYDVEVEDND